MRLLLVEDNKSLAKWLGRTLSKEYTVDWVGDGEQADALLRTESFDLVILDLALPRLDGSGVLRRLRARGVGTPVLVLTADTRPQSCVTELDSGADDFVAKPFRVEELEARIRVLLRRSFNKAEPLLRRGQLEFDSNTRTFQLAGQPLQLTPRERAVLELLMLQAGSTVAKTALAQSLASFDQDVTADAIEIYVYRLRKKLEGSDVAIVTLRGLGYLLRQVDNDG